MAQFAKQTISLGKAGEIEVDPSKFSAEVTAYVFNYGLKQMLNDVHAGEKDPEAKVGLSQKKLDSLYRGEVAQARSGGGDPVEKEARTMAEGDIKTALKAAGKKLADIEKGTIRAAVDKLMESKGDKYREKAKAKLAIKVEGGAIDVDSLLGDALAGE